MHFLFPNRHELLINNGKEGKANNIFRKQNCIYPNNTSFLDSGRIDVLWEGRLYSCKAKLITAARLNLLHVPYLREA